MSGVQDRRNGSRSDINTISLNDPVQFAAVSSGLSVSTVYREIKLGHLVMSPRGFNDGDFFRWLQNRRTRLSCWTLEERAWLASLETAAKEIRN